MRRSAKFLIGAAVAVSGFATLSSSASAATIDIGENGNEPITVTSIPANTLFTASVVSVPGWTVNTSTPAVTNFAISNPITLSVGSTIVVSFDIGVDAYSDTMTIEVGGIVRSGNEVLVTALGELMGPGAGPNSSELDLTFNQAGGTGHTITASGTYATNAVPEPSTWAMMVLGFLGLGYAAFRRNAKAGTAAIVT